jgi:uncharacterized damage-inducible protein DinB
MPAFEALASTLRELRNVIRPLTRAQYTRREVNASGSIGAHVRHCLDHVCALECGIATGEISYDHRTRNTVVEHDPEFAAARLRRAISRLGGVADYLLDRPLTLVAQIDQTGQRVRVATSVGRELTFVISHTIHHSAMIAVLLEQAGQDLPARFGVAPTTPALGTRDSGLGARVLGLVSAESRIPSPESRR